MNEVFQIKNEELNGYLNDCTKTKGNPMTIGPADPEWEMVMGRSAGAPLAQAVTDHPDVFHKSVPTKVFFVREGANGQLMDMGMWKAEFSLEPAA